MKKKLKINTDAAVKDYNERRKKSKQEDYSLDAEFENKEGAEGHDQKKKKDGLTKVSYFHLYRYATTTDKLSISIAILCSLAAGVGTPLIMIFFGDITGGIVTYASQLYSADATTDTTEAEEALMDIVISFVINCSIIGVSVFVLSYISIALFSITCTNQICRIRALFMQAVLNQDIGWYDVNQTGDFTSRITEDMLKIEEGIGDKVATFWFFMSASSSSLIVALVYGWELALICLISLPVTAFALGFISWITTKTSMKEMESYGSAGAIAEEVLGAIKTVMAFGGQQKEIDRYKVHLETVCKNNSKRALLTGISNGVMWFIMFASYSLSFYYGIGLVIKERDLPVEEQTYNAGTMITVFFCVLIASFTLTQCMPYFQIFGTAQGAASKVLTVIDNQPEINLSKGQGTKLDACKGHIVFEDVEFHYPSREDVPILKGINLEIFPGQTVALVGSSGCGKSTCIQLLQRYYDPTKGKITVDGEDIKSFDLDWYREHIGVVGQEPVLFGMSIKENIKFGRKNATDEDIVKACQKANAHSFVNALPDRYNTLVGERGSQLSGGQKQRIAIARALVREPTILLLDEATSALDTHSEALVQRAIDSITKECTTIIVAHRLSTIRNANKIIVFSDGQIVETGTHDELMRSKGVYYNLVITQVTQQELEQTASETSLQSSMEEEKIDMDKVNDIKDTTKTKVKHMSAITNVLALNKPEWWQIVIGAISAVVSGAAMPVYAVVFGDVMGVFLYEDPEEVRSEGNRYSIYFLIIGIVCGIAMFFQWYMIGIAGEKLTKRVRALLFETVLRQEPGWFDREENGVGAVCAKLSSEAASIQGASGHPVIVALNSLSTLIIAISISMYFEWRLSLVSMTIMPFIFLGTFFETKSMQGGGSGDVNALENSAKIAVDAVGNIRTVASLGCEETFYTLYTTEMVPYYKKAKRSAHMRALVLGMSRCLMNFAYIIAFWYGGALIVQERLDYTVVFKVSEGLISAAWSVGNVMAFSPNFQKAVIAADKMFNLLRREPKIRDDENSTHTGWPRGDITYDQIKFSYPTRPNITIVDSLNLAVTHGKTVALVGPSGCGKSTIVQLLQRFYDPDSGRVLIDDINLKNIKIAALRSRLGIVSQEPNLFDRTIRDNIAYGDNQRVVTQDEIEEAAKNANIHTFIGSLPLGYETRLGQKGTQLSGGQKQRIAIARALVRNPNILLLDEATSALDMESEKIVQEALDKAKLGRTCITIAHRLTTIQDADVIFVFSKGQIVEHGTHSDLLKRRGLYHKLYSLQKRQ